MKRKLAYLTAVLATAGLAACTTPTTQTTIDAGQGVTLSPEQALQAFHWSLIDTVKSDGTTVPAWVSTDPMVENTPLTLTFNEDRVAIQGLCNNMSAGYALNKQNIDFSKGVTTLRMCADPELMQYERQVSELFPTAKSWAIVGADQTVNTAPVLSLRFDNGDVWNLQGQPTNETKYGSAGETVFLEIAPKTVACTDGGENCLEVRTVYYDENSIKTGVSEWTQFQPNAIEGFTHQDGIHNVLRTKRYNTATEPVYVLDMVVQSGLSN